MKIRYKHDCIEYGKKSFPVDYVVVPLWENRCLIFMFGPFESKVLDYYNGSAKSENLHTIIIEDNHRDYRAAADAVIQSIGMALYRTKDEDHSRVLRGHLEALNASL